MVGAGTQPSRDPGRAGRQRPRHCGARRPGGGVGRLRRPGRGGGRGDVAHHHRGRREGGDRGRRRHHRGGLPARGLRRARPGARRAGAQRGHRVRHGRRRHVHPTTGTGRSPSTCAPTSCWCAAPSSRCPTTRPSSSWARSPACGPGAASPPTTPPRRGSSASAATWPSRAPAAASGPTCSPPGLIDTPLGRAASAGRPSRTRSPVPARPPGHGVGGGGGGRVPALGRGELHHRAGPGRRRGADARMSAHSGAAAVGVERRRRARPVSAGAWRASTGP